MLSHSNISQYLNKADIVRETAEQIMKDFSLFGLEITFSGDTTNAYNELHRQLIKEISVLIEKDYGRLLSVLYQVDITEKEMARAAVEFPDYNQVELIAHQIIVRDLKKVLIRNYFKIHKHKRES